MLKNVESMDKTDVTPIEQYVIDKVRELRTEKGISQRELANLLDLSNGFIGNAESNKRRAKYNLNHINGFAKLFKCSLKDFLPDEPI
jgi:transcriptional regulator with XRE-family HTH domain